MNESYLKQTLIHIPRLLGLLDRCEVSDSYGCFDRLYWKYKAKDFCNARLQEAALTLCLLFLKRSSNNNYYKNERIKDLAISACAYWSRIQRRDGSFDEYIPNEKSHVATVFSSYCVAYCYYLLSLNNQRILDALKRAAEWVNMNDDLEVTNHDACSVPLFYLMYKVTGDSKYLQYLKKKLTKVLDNQDEEGWFKEYGKADIGYQSYTIYYLAKYYSLSKDTSVLVPLEKAIRFFGYFIHPDGTIGGEYGSRCTDLVLPAGFEIMKYEIPLAYTIAKRIKYAVTEKKIICPHSFDDRFIAQELYTYLDSEEKISNPSKKECLPLKNKNFRKVFKNSGLCVIKSGEYCLVSNLIKGGIGKVFKGNKLQNELLPYSFNKKNKVYSTYGPSVFKIEDGSITIKGCFYIYKSRFQSPLTAILLRFINMMGGGIFAKKMIRKKLVHETKKTRYSFKRVINLENLEVKDSFTGVDENLPKLSRYFPVYSTSTQFVK